MKRTLLILTTVMATATAMAGDYPYLTLQTADGTQKPLAVESLVITFSDGQLVATNAEGTQTFTLTDLTQMFFSADGQETAIEAIGAELTDGDAEIFDLQGRRVENMSRKGIYIVRENGKTRKVLVK